MPPSPDSPVPPPVGAAVGSSSPAPSLSLSRASSDAVPTLTDFLDLATLEEIQEGFSAITSVRATIRDAAGKPLLTPDDTLQRRRSDSLLSQLLLTDGPNAQGPFEVPIVVNGYTLGSIAIDFPEDSHQHAAQQQQQGVVASAAEAIMAPVNVARAKLMDFAHTLGIAEDQADPFIAAAQDCCSPKRAAAVQFLQVLASAIARLCQQDYQLRHRYEELAALHSLSTLLSTQRDLRLLLDTATRQVAQVMNVKAASIRLLDAKGLLVPRAVFNLSPSFLEGTPVVLSKSKVHQAALSGQVVYVADMRSDKRTLHPSIVAQEGLVSTLCAGIVSRGKPVGVLNVYTDTRRDFSHAQRELLQSIAHLLAGAIASAQLETARRDGLLMQQQLQLGADVQRRMLPATMPKVRGFDIAARCVQSYDVGGDFYDFLALEDNLGIVIGDVVGKGIAASLLMASVRATLRAYAQEVYDLDEVITRVNKFMCRDSREGEFVTLFYGVLDPVRKRLTYCNAGHEPPLLLRDGRFQPLEAGGMILGIDPDQRYEKGFVDLRPGDAVVLFTDGLTEALNFSNQAFGRRRVRSAIRESATQPTAADALGHVLWHMRNFTGLSNRTDDTTLVVLRATE
jgi:sigma-B regulation protein RsbU (phosphoserine phosphatase)